MIKYVSIMDISSPKQWKTIPTSQFLSNGFPVYGANGKIGFYNQYNHSKPTIAITCRGATCGSIHITEPKSYITGNAMALDELDEERVFIKYLFYILKKRGFNDIISGSAQPQIIRSSFSNIKIPLPPLKEQKRIASILDKADEIRQKRRESLKLADEYLRSVFLDMFGDPVTNPKGWEFSDFGKFIEVLTDYHANGSYQTLKKHVDLLNTPNYALMVRTTDLESNNFEHDVKYISKEAYNFLKKSQIFGGEIIINKIGSAGNVYLMPDLNRPVSLGMNSFLVRLKTIFNNIFAYYLLTSQYGTVIIQNNVRGAVTKTITKDAIRSLPLPNPPFTIQQQFAEIVKKTEEVKAKMQAQLDEAENLFGSLMQRAFRGEL